MAELEQENVFITNLAGVEDLLLGYENEQQIRDGEITVTSAINAHNIPYTHVDPSINTVGDALDKLFTLGGTV